MDPITSGAVALNSSLYWERFEEAENCFLPKSGASCGVEIVDIPISTSATPSQQHCKSLDQLDEYFQNNQNYKDRLICINQNYSWGRLQITKPMLKSIINNNEINPEAIEVFLSFFQRETDEEQGYCVPFTLFRNGSLCELFYTFKYAHHKGLPSEPWVIRQSGVYHKFDTVKKTSIWILVNPTTNSTAQLRATNCFLNHRHMMNQNPMWLHSVIYASYFGRWRDYIAEYEKRLLPIADTTTATFINETLRLNYDTLGKIRYLESRYLPLPAILDNFSDVVLELEALVQILCVASVIDTTVASSFALQLRQYRRQSTAFLRTARFLQQRSNNTSILLADALAFKNQDIAQKQNVSMLTLTKSAVFITILTLFYLPWTLMTGIFGMNFFTLNQNNFKFVVSPKLWMFFVSSVALTVLTMILYYMMTRLPNVQEITKEKKVPRTRIHHPACGGSRQTSRRTPHPRKR